MLKYRQRVQKKHDMVNNVQTEHDMVKNAASHMVKNVEISSTRAKNTTWSIMCKKNTSLSKMQQVIWSKMQQVISHVIAQKLFQTTHAEFACSPLGFAGRCEPDSERRGILVGWRRWDRFRKSRAAHDSRLIQQTNSVRQSNRLTSKPFACLSFHLRIRDYSKQTQLGNQTGLHPNLPLAWTYNKLTDRLLAYVLRTFCFAHILKFQA